MRAEPTVSSIRRSGPGMFHRIVELVVGPATADEAEEGAVRNDWDRLRSEART